MTSQKKAKKRLKLYAAGSLAGALAFGSGGAGATEGALGRPVAGTSVLSSVGTVAPADVWVVNVQELYLNGSISGSHGVPIGGQESLGLDGKVSFTLATIERGWGKFGGWDFASAFTLPYVWEEVTATSAVGRAGLTTTDRASNLYDMYFTPIIAGYSFSQNDHLALSFNFWAPTGQYDVHALANASLNNWTFVPQVAYTKLVPQYGLEFDGVLGLQFYTRNPATQYQNAPLLTLDVMGLKKFANGVGVGVVMGTVQQLGKDTGSIAGRLDGFVGHDFAMGPIITYDTKIGGKLPVSASLRWVPTIASANRLKSTSTVQASATLAF
ncbi:SphA family protein [Paraburkholderia sacchari]|uniref:SphA family protein n=1 Tax=Paraburkholderia sacchari TaxID=159450 RepID=UPI001BCF3363|nr:transporter [Paraburkholderia sacchari]